MDFLPTEILVHEILPNLSRRDLVFFKRCSTTTLSLTSNNNLLLIWTHKVELYLYQIFGEDLPFLYDFLETTSSVISGSAIIQSIIEEYYENSDIDFICPCEMIPIQKFCNILDRPLILSSQEGYDWDSKEEKVITDIYECNYLGYEVIEGDWNILVGLDDVQFVDSYESKRVPRHLKSDYKNLNFITTCVTPQAHIDTYDLTIVQNSYSRKGVDSISRYERHGKLTIKDPNAILNKHLIVDNPTKRYLYRIKKYLNRGYKIYSPSISIDLTLLKNLLPLERYYRGQITTSITNDLQQTLCSIDKALFHYPCFLEFDCFLKNFERLYSHVHIVPFGIESFNSKKKHKLHKYCSELIIEINS